MLRGATALFVCLFCFVLFCLSVSLFVCLSVCLFLLDSASSAFFLSIRINTFSEGCCPNSYFLLCTMFFRKLWFIVVSCLSFEVHKQSPKQPSVTVQERLSTLLSWDEGARPQTELTDCVSKWDGQRIYKVHQGRKKMPVELQQLPVCCTMLRAKREDPSPEVVQSLRGKLWEVASAPRTLGGATGWGAVARVCLGIISGRPTWHH